MWYVSMKMSTERWSQHGRHAWLKGEKWRSHPTSGCSIRLMQCELNFPAFVTEGLASAETTVERLRDISQGNTHFWGPEGTVSFPPRDLGNATPPFFFRGNCSGSLPSAACWGLPCLFISEMHLIREARLTSSLHINLISWFTFNLHFN